jgi:signal transduction histidine kinase
MSISLYRILLLLLTGVFVVALVPAGIALDRRLSSELEQKARDDLSMAPKIMADRNATVGGALMMHAKEMAQAEGLPSALAAADTARASRLAEEARVDELEEIILVGPEGDSWAGPEVGATLIEQTRLGQMPVAFVTAVGQPFAVSLAPVMEGDAWMGAAGVARALDEAFAATLAGLTRAEVVILAPDGSVPAMAAADSALGASVADSTEAWKGDGAVHTLVMPDDRTYWVTAASLDEAGTVLFATDAAARLAVLPALRRGALIAGGIALGLALVMAAFAASLTVRPVRTLARAADRLAEGDFDAPVEGSMILEVDRVSAAFRNMRQALATKLDELEAANRELLDRQEKLKQLQAEMIQRDRLVASGKLVTELAHEIRNPVANVRNCLEVIRRRLDDDELRQFAELAMGELLRLHSLAEQTLDLNRPVDPEASTCDPDSVVRLVLELFRTGVESGGVDIHTGGSAGGEAAIAPDALKQVLLNVLQNAREAMPEGGEIRVHLERRDGIIALAVEDSGPGIAPDVLPRVFDPFFTTKGDVHGVGLGLFVAEGIVRRYGGRLVVANRTDVAGAALRIELPAVRPASERVGEKRTGGLD